MRVPNGTIEEERVSEKELKQTRALQRMKQLQRYIYTQQTHKYTKPIWNCVKKTSNIFSA
jgi:hypothetical protein